MTTDQQSDLRRDGVVGPFPAFAAPEQLLELADYFRWILETRAIQPIYGEFSVRDWHLVSEPLLKLLTSEELGARLRAVTGARSLMLWRSKIFEKYPGDGPIDWHQEYGYFDGEEVGGHRPALYPLGAASPWTWTLWLPVTDVSPDDGVMEFVLGSHNVRYATRMVPLTRSGAYIDPVSRISSKEELVDQARANTLILDIDTRHVFDQVDVDGKDLEELLSILRHRLDEQLAVVTEPFDVPETRTVPMQAGQYILFDQRTMHRSRGAGPSAKLRLAISGRYTLGTTLVYPQKRGTDSLDGSNLDIARHRCVRLYGSEFHEDNEYL